jgi:hypothetical protein
MNQKYSTNLVESDLLYFCRYFETQFLFMKHHILNIQDVVKHFIVNILKCLNDPFINNFLF